MAIQRIQLWQCDAPCVEEALPGSDGWFGNVHSHGCPAHAALVEAHAANLRFDARGRCSRATTTVVLHCVCGWAPRPAWTHGSTDEMFLAHRAHIADMATDDLSCGSASAKQAKHREKIHELAHRIRECSTYLVNYAEAGTPHFPDLAGPYARSISSDIFEIRMRLAALEGIES